MSEEIRAQSYVGFDSITQQIEHKLLKRGFQFNVIVVGEFSPYTYHRWCTLLAGCKNGYRARIRIASSFLPFIFLPCYFFRLAHIWLPLFFYIGQTGLGKSTLINTIFASHLIDSKGRLASEEAVRKTTEIQAASHGMFCSCQNENEFSVVGLLWISFFYVSSSLLKLGTSFSNP